METHADYTRELNHLRLSMLKMSIGGGKFSMTEQVLADPLRLEIDQILVRATAATSRVQLT